jgi:FtsP/CotA-like multicopper oxidase with cupredoxin domain
VRRRELLRAGLAGAGGALLGACTGQSSPDRFVDPAGPEVRAIDAGRGAGTVRDVRLTAVAGPVDLGGRTVHTWTYDGAVPGTPIRVRAGQRVRARLVNRLPTHTTVHWHGVALRNDADGVEGVTQAAVAPGEEYSCEFTVSHAGTYWLHPHAGLQLDRGLYAPLIVEDPHEPLAYDDEWVVVLDDWLDDVDGRDPEQVYAELRKAGRMMSPGGHMPGLGGSELLGADGGEVSYPLYLLNGRTPDAPATVRLRPGARLRLRLINAAGDTAFRVALGGHRLRITHADGFPVRPVEGDAVLIGMGERYDAVVTLADGVFPLVAVAEGKGGAAAGVIRTGVGAVPPAAARPVELNRRTLTQADLRPADDVRLSARPPDRVIDLALTGGMMSFSWGFNGREYDPARLEAVRHGERVRLNLVNTTMMWHPVHMHGHTFAVADSGLRKDTLIVAPGRSVAVDLDADNPGRWMVHCHNVYHAEAGMMTLLGYLR